MKNSGKKITIVLTVLASVLIAYAVMNQNSDNEEYVESENLKTVAVNIGTAQEMTYKKVQHLTGTVEGLTSAIISSRYSEKVSEIFVENGQKVVKGQALLRTDDTELSNNLMIARNALRKAQVNYDNASATYRRNKLIFDKGAVSSQYLETLAAQLEVCRADVEDAKSNVIIAKKNLEDSVVRSSVDGVVADKNVTLGQIVSSGSQLMTVEQIDYVYITVQIPQQDIATVQIGGKASINVDAYAGKVFTGEVAVINPVAGRESRLFEVKIKVDNQNYLLKPGMFGEVSLADDNSETGILVIPRQALFSRKGQNYVFVADEDGTAKKIRVETGELIDDSLEITSGLKAGDKVILDNLDILMDGSPVTTYEEE